MPAETTSKKLFTVEEYHRMAEVGILQDTARFELVRGEIIEMTVPGSAHSGRVNRLNRLFTSRLHESVIVSVQNPVRLDIHSEPVPDLALLRPRDDFYAEAHPSAGDVLLVVEISDTTVRYDSGIKAGLYAGAGIPEYWVLDITRDVLVVRTDPAAGEYTTVHNLRRGETVSPRKLRAVVFSIDDILG